MDEMALFKGLFKAEMANDASGLVPRLDRLPPGEASAFQDATTSDDRRRVVGSATRGEASVDAERREQVEECAFPRSRLGTLARLPCRSLG
jgi:hypothetical protein